MNTIEIDFDVYKALTNRRPSESVTYNDVLRQLLGLKPAAYTAPAPASSTPNAGDWITKGVRFPAGTEFRANHKGETYFGKVEGGALVVRGQKFHAPSPAAASITSNSRNGWTFWEARRPGEGNWGILKSFRNGK